MESGELRVRNLCLFPRTIILMMAFGKSMHFHNYRCNRTSISGPCVVIIFRGACAIFIIMLLLSRRTTQVVLLLRTIMLHMTLGAGRAAAHICIHFLLNMIAGVASASESAPSFSTARERGCVACGRALRSNGPSPAPP